MKKFGIAWFVLFFIPIVVFLPIFVEEKVWIRNNDIDSGIGEWTLFAFIVGYPSIFVIFYTWRCIANVLPSEVKAMGFPIAVYFFFFFCSYTPWNRGAFDSREVYLLDVG